MQADMRVLRLDRRRRLWLDTEAEAPATPSCEHLSMYKIGREVEIEDRAGDAGDDLA